MTVTKEKVAPKDAETTPAAAAAAAAAAVAEVTEIAKQFAKPVDETAAPPQAPVVPAAVPKAAFEPATEAVQNQVKRRWRETEAKKGGRKVFETPKLTIEKLQAGLCLPNSVADLTPKCAIYRSPDAAPLWSEDGYSVCDEFRRFCASEGHILRLRTGRQTTTDGSWFRIFVCQLEGLPPPVVAARQVRQEGELAPITGLKPQAGQRNQKTGVKHAASQRCGCKFSVVLKAKFEGEGPEREFVVRCDYLNPEHSAEEGYTHAPLKADRTALAPLFKKSADVEAGGSAFALSFAARMGKIAQALEECGADDVSNANRMMSALEDVVGDSEALSACFDAFAKEAAKQKANAASRKKDEAGQKRPADKEAENARVKRPAK